MFQNLMVENLFACLKVQTKDNFKLQHAHLHVNKWENCSGKTLVFLGICCLVLFRTCSMVSYIMCVGSMSGVKENAHMVPLYQLKRGKPSSKWTQSHTRLYVTLLWIMPGSRHWHFM